MSLPIASWYCGSTKWNGVAAWGASAAYAAGALVRQLAAPAIGSERVFVCIAAGTSGSAEPTWTITKGAKTTDGTVTWQEVTGQAAVNGDLTNAPKWATIPSTAITLGYTIQDAAADTYFICTTAGTTGSTEPTWNKTAGATTTDGGATWTSIGAVGNFTAWGAAHARLSGAIPWTGAGDTLFVSNNHAETQASALTLPVGGGTIAAPIRILCVTDTVAPSSTTATTASVTTTGASNMTIAAPANSYWYGLNFVVGSAANTALLNMGQSNQYFESCSFTLGNTSSSSYMNYNFANNSYDASAITYKNCTFVFGATTQSFYAVNNYGATFIGGSIAATGSVPASLFLGAAYYAKIWFMLLRDVDLSAITGTLFDASGNNSIVYGSVNMANCKLGAGVTIARYNSSTFNNYLPYTKVYASDSAAVTYRYSFSNYLGSVANENTVVRSGGASDGTTTISWNITTSAFASVLTPFISEEIPIWNNVATLAKTATFYLTSNSPLTNNDLWLEVEYLKNTGNPQGGVATTKMPLLGTSTALTTDTSTWGGSTTYKYKVVVPFTPQMKGVVKARIFVAKPSITVYVDPLLNIV